MGGTIVASLALGLFPPEPVRCAGSLLVRDAIRRKERAQGAGQRPLAIDIRLRRFAAAAGKADKG